MAIKPNASYVWKSIASTRDIIRELGELGMEQMFHFGLIAGCLGDLCAIELIMEPFLNNQTLVKDFLTEDRCWEKTLLEQILPHELVEIVMGCPLARFVIGSDKLIWSLNSNGIFSTKSCVQYASSKS